MVFIINSDDFKIDSTCIGSQIRGANISLKGFPTFYSESGNYITPINLWINYLINVKRAKNINSNFKLHYLRGRAENGFISFSVNILCISLMPGNCRIVFIEKSAYESRSRDTTCIKKSASPPML